MKKVRAKKRLGQHFLTDKDIAKRIVDSLQSPLQGKIQCLEIGAGMGILTGYLLENKKLNLSVVEIDSESVLYLKQHFPQLENQILEADFLRLNLAELFDNQIVIIGNFPYNISSQILFKALENREQVHELVGMFQREVAMRIAAPPGSRTYGILSVLLQAYFDIEYLFEVDETVFSPPPKVKSAVIRLTRNQVSKLNCDEKLFLRVVKTAFNQRRKTLRNSLKSIIKEAPALDIFKLRPEQLSVRQFVELTLLVENS